MHRRPISTNGCESYVLRSLPAPFHPSCRLERHRAPTPREYQIKMQAVIEFTAVLASLQHLLLFEQRRRATYLRGDRTSIAAHS